MLKVIFKITKKIKLEFKKFNNLFTIFELKSLYAERFFCKKDLCFGNFFLIFFDLSNSSLSLGTHIEFRNFCEIRSGKNSTLTIGNNVFFNNYCSLNCLYNIIIGNDCQFGEGVKFYDHNHQYHDSEIKINEQGYTYGEIIVGNNCWIGSNVIILKNVTIGDNVVIGAGCIIHKSIVSNTTIYNNQTLSIM